MEQAYCRVIITEFKHFILTAQHSQKIFNWSSDYESIQLSLSYILYLEVLRRRFIVDNLSGYFALL